MDWAYTNGDKAASDLGYVPLPASTKDEIRGYWASKKIK
jgi:phosphate transport system substrate-binding protein